MQDDALRCVPAPHPRPRPALGPEARPRPEPLSGRPRPWLDAAWVRARSGAAPWRCDPSDVRASAAGALGLPATAEAAAVPTCWPRTPGGRGRPASTSARRGGAVVLGRSLGRRDRLAAPPWRRPASARPRSRCTTRPRPKPKLGVPQSRGALLGSSPAPASSRSACRACPRPEPQAAWAGLPRCHVPPALRALGRSLGPHGLASRGAAFRPPCVPSDGASSCTGWLPAASRDGGRWPLPRGTCERRPVRPRPEPRIAGAALTRCRATSIRTLGTGVRSRSIVASDGPLPALPRSRAAGPPVLTSVPGAAFPRRARVGRSRTRALPRSRGAVASAHAVTSVVTTGGRLGLGGSPGLERLARATPRPRPVPRSMVPRSRATQC